MKIKDNKIPANNKNIAICFMVAHCFFMSLGTVLLKLMQFDYHITQIMFFYNLLLCVTLLCLSFFGRKSLRLSCANIKYHFLRSIFGFGGFVLFFYSLSNMPINEVRAIISLDPILTALFAVLFFQESINKMKMISFITTFIGAIILLHPENIQLSTGAITSLLAAISFGIYNNVTKKITTGKTIDQIFYLSLFSLLYTTIPAIYYWNPIIKLQDIFLIFGIAILFMLSSVTVFHAFKRAELSLIMPIHFLGVIMTAILGFLCFDEKIGYFTIIGTFVITIGMMPLFLKRSDNT
jgi:drug/metabolite transporter (DMT)-like permease